MSNLLVLRKQEEQRYTLGIVYEPDIPDSHGDFAKAEDIEIAAWEFMAKIQSFAKSGARMMRELSKMESSDSRDLMVVVDEELLKSGDGLDDEHMQVEEQCGTIVESYIAPADFQVGEQLVKKGTWLLGVVWEPEIFEKVVTGERTGLSMFGRTDKVKE